MKTDNLKIHKVFSGGGDVQYILPHFQRQYSWDKENWETLLKDAIAIYGEYDPQNPPEHFLGSLVVIEDGVVQGLIPVFKLVDGQQRLTTISLLLCALREIVKETLPPLYRTIQKMLLNDTDDTLVRFKLLPTTKYNDQAAYINIVEQGQSANQTSNIPKAYEYFRHELNSKIASGEINAQNFFLALINSFQVVFINLNKDESPYKIFESLNAKGRSLSQADLVRNYIAMRLPGAKQEQVFNQSWSKIEDLLQEKRTVGKSRIGELTGFLRHYLAMRTRVLCNEEHIYARFRDRMEQEFKTDASFIEEMATLKRFAEYYAKLLRPEPEKDVNANLLNRLRIMDITTAYPFLLAAYDAQYTKVLTAEQLKELLEVLENYIVRRYIVGEPTNYLNKLFPTLWQEISASQFSASLRTALASKNYPTDQKVQEAIFKNNFYSNTAREKTVLILESIEQYLWQGTGTIVKLDDNASLEHIMPQSISNMPEWQTELGENWQQIHADNLHRLGNLTLVTQKWNVSLSNGPFGGQNGKKSLLIQHGLRLNSQYFSEVERWDEAAIQKRAKFLGEKVLEIWPSFGSAIDKSISSVVYTTPEVVIINDKSFEVNTWREVIYTTAEYLIKQGKFEAIQKEAPTYFKENNLVKKTDSDYRLLSNGWVVYVKRSGDSSIDLCRRFVRAAGMNEASWKVQTKQVPRQDK